MELLTRIEALLFASDQPLGLARLCEVLPEATRAEIEAALGEIEAEYAAARRAFRLLHVAGGYQLATKPELAEVVRRLFTGKRRLRLTKAALESLAIIAYKQPTTRPDIDAIRGVASGGVLETLLERNLIRIAGRSQGIGRPLLYATTPEFLHYLALERLADLPSLEELESMLAEREAASRQAEDEEMLGLAQAALQAGAAPPDEAEGRPAAARVADESDLAGFVSLAELDEELGERSRRVAELSSRLAAERARLAAEAGVPVEAEAAAGAAAALAPEVLPGPEAAPPQGDGGEDAGPAPGTPR